MAALEQAVQRALRLDPASSIKLGKLDGKIFHIDLIGPGLQLYIAPQNNTINLIGYFDGDASTKVSGKPSDFIELLAADDAGSALINGNITLQGDSASLLELQAILHNLELDWEAELASLIGDMPAHQLGKAIRSGAKWGKQTHNSLLRQVEEYIHEEGRLAPPRAELEDFYHDVSKLKDDTDRLAAKIAQLGSKIAARTKPKV